MRERGFPSSGTAPVLIVLFVQSVVVGVLWRSSQGSPSMARELQHAATTVSLPNYALGVLAVAAIALLTRFFLFRRPVESGLLWSLGAFFLALRFGGTGRISTAYFSAATFILAISCIWASYPLSFSPEFDTLPSR